VKLRCHIPKAASILCIALVYHSQAFAASPQTAPVPTQQTPAVRCGLSVTTHDWQLGGPAPISVELRNTSDSPLDLIMVPELSLVPNKGAKQPAAGYWSPVDIVENRALDTVQESKGGAVSIKAKPLNVHLEKNSVVTFKVDANKTKWGQQISSRWPALPFSQAVLPGDYIVGLALGDRAEGVQCNNVEVRVSAGQKKAALVTPH
jgi:hypothetical protein